MEGTGFMLRDMHRKSEKNVVATPVMTQASQIVEFCVKCNLLQEVNAPVNFGVST